MVLDCKPLGAAVENARQRLGLPEVHAGQDYLGSYLAAVLVAPGAIAILFLLRPHHVNDGGSRIKVVEKKDDVLSRVVRRRAWKSRHRALATALMDIALDAEVAALARPVRRPPPAFTERDAEELLANEETPSWLKQWAFLKLRDPGLR